VNQCFEKADINQDGVLDFEEFKSAVLQHQIVVQSFWKAG
jgi:Ca2+-binding EF-hand superfamily protein